MKAILGTCTMVLAPLSVFAGGQVPQIGRRPGAVRGYASFAEVYAAAEGVHRFCASTGWVPLGKFAGRCFSFLLGFSFAPLAFYSVPLAGKSGSRV